MESGCIRSIGWDQFTSSSMDSKEASGLTSDPVNFQFQDSDSVHAIHAINIETVPWSS